MKALSVMQPWAWLIVNGHKDIENRDWKPANPALRFRGKVLIHTGLKIDAEASDDVAENIHPVSCFFPLATPLNVPAAWETGGIVGEAEIVDVVTKSDSPWFVGPIGLIIRNARPLEFRPCVGALGFFEPDYSKTYAPKKAKPPALPDLFGAPKR